MVQASPRERGASVSKKRKRLSGRLDTKMMDSLASGEGGRRVKLCWVICWVNCKWSRTFCFVSFEWKLKMMVFLSCMGEKKLAQLTSTFVDIHMANLFALSMGCPLALLGSFP